MGPIADQGHEWSGEMERLCELKQKGCHLNVEIAEIKQRMDSNQRAVELAAEAMNQRLMGMNEVREQLTRQAAETIRREEVILMLEKATERFGLEIKALAKLVNNVGERENRIIVMLGLTLLTLCGTLALQLILVLGRH